MSASFSIFIPVWNDAAWLDGAITSVLAQTYPKWELIIGDNAADDDIAAVVARYPDPRIRYQRWPTHVGIYENFNRTALLCQHDWLQLLCADDRLEPTCLQRLADIIDAEQIPGDSRPLAAVLTNCQRVDETGRPADDRYYGSLRLKTALAGRYDAEGWVRLMAAPGAPPWNFGSVALARAVVAQMGGFFRPEVGLCSDNEALIRIAAYGDVHYLDERLLRYTVRGDSDGNIRFVRNLAAAEPETPMGLALRHGLLAHEARGTATPAMRWAVAEALASLYLQRANQHRVLTGGLGRRAAAVDVWRALAVNPWLLREPRPFVLAAGALVAPRAALTGGSRLLTRLRRRGARVRDAGGNRPRRAPTAGRSHRRSPRGDVRRSTSEGSRLA